MTAGIIGATGYAGAELVRLLARHPSVDAMILGSVSSTGDHIEDIYLNFLGNVSLVLESPDRVVEGSDVVFAALPHGVGEAYALACQQKGIHFIDLSADFRFDEAEGVFSAWYGKPYVRPELRERSIYGLPELNRERIKELAKAGPAIVGNPGCYPTGASLGAFPALAKGIAGDGVIIVDSASGITGGGRDPSRSFHFPECSDTMSPYKVGSHRHTPEIARNFEAMAGKKVPLIFTPHLAPMNRGILSSIYIPLSPEFKFSPDTGRLGAPPGKDIAQAEEKIRLIYRDFYRDEPFVRVLPPGTTAATGRVRQSNFCDISIHLDLMGSTLIVITALDNMVKGAAGQAVQNMNILLDYPENAGLQAIPALF